MVFKKFRKKSRKEKGKPSKRDSKFGKLRTFTGACTLGFLKILWLGKGPIILIIWLSFSSRFWETNLTDQFPKAPLVKAEPSSKLRELLDGSRSSSVGIPPFVLNRKGSLEEKINREANEKDRNERLNNLEEAKEELSKNLNHFKKKLALAEKQNKNLKEKLNLTLDDVHFFLAEIDKKNKIIEQNNLEYSKLSNEHKVLKDSYTTKKTEMKSFQEILSKQKFVRLELANENKALKLANKELESQKKELKASRNKALDQKLELLRENQDLNG